MSETITYVELEKEFKKICDEYASDVNTAVKSEVERVTKMAVSDLKKKSPKDTRAYSKSWTKKVVKSPTNAESIVFNKKHYQRTHLLENGHLKRSGTGRVKGIKHIEPVNTKIIKEFYQGVVRAICK